MDRLSSEWFVDLFTDIIIGYLLICVPISLLMLGLLYLLRKEP